MTGSDSVDSESEPDNEIWDEDKDDIANDVLNKQQPSNSNDDIMIANNSDVKYAKWVVKFLLAIQAVFRITDAAIEYILRFIKVIFLIMGQHCKIIINETSQRIPNSIYKLKRLSTAPTFQRYVTCKKCNSIKLIIFIFRLH